MHANFRVLLLRDETIFGGIISRSTKEFNFLVPLGELSFITHPTKSFAKDLRRGGRGKLRVIVASFATRNHRGDQTLIVMAFELSRKFGLLGQCIFQRRARFHCSDGNYHGLLRRRAVAKQHSGVRSKVHGT